MVFGWPRRDARDRVRLVDEDAAPEPEPLDVLLRITAEAVILQDEAEGVLAAVGRHESLGALAPRGGPLVRRFFSLREQLPGRCADPQLERLHTVLDTILYHHAVQVATALDFLAVEWRSERAAQQVESISGLGFPARRLEDVYRELRARRG